MASAHTLDLTKGSVTKKLLQFAFPIIVSGLLQHIYTIADRIVVGNFAENGKIALAAVGSTAAATNLLLNFFLGLAVGVNVVCANFRGAGEAQQLRKSMHTSMLLSVALGIVLGLLGVFASPALLRRMGTPEDVLPSATLYMQIYFLGMPGALVYNFGASIMRAYGDAKRSMYILGVTGLVNVVLNLVLVIGFRMDVAGVAIATIVAQYLSAVAVVWILFRPRQEYGMRMAELRIHWQMLKKVIAIGLPCGINAILQSVTNVMIQSSINGFNSADIIAGNTTATDINTISYLFNTAFSSACVSFAGQCYGAKEYKRLDQLALSASVSNCAILTVLATVVTLFPRQLLGLFTSDPNVIEAGIFKMILCSWSTILFGISEVMVGCVRGMGKSTQPTVLNLICICGARLAWIWFVFPLCPYEPAYLYLCFPVSWFLAAVCQSANFILCRKKLPVSKTPLA